MPDVQVSVVIPVYNSQDCLDELARRLADVLDGSGRTYEIVLVDDCSPDNSWQKIVELCQTYDQLKAINLRRNFGQDNGGCPNRIKDGKLGHGQAEIKE